MNIHLLMVIAQTFEDSCRLSPTQFTPPDGRVVRVTDEAVLFAVDVHIYCRLREKTLTDGTQTFQLHGKRATAVKLAVEFKFHEISFPRSILVTSRGSSRGCP